MDREKAEKLGTLFLAVFSTGLALQCALDGLVASPGQWAGAAAAALGSITVAVMVRVWPRMAPAARRERR